jgi:hypothetical protein
MAGRGLQVCDVHKRDAQVRRVVTVRFSLFIVVAYWYGTVRFLFGEPLLHVLNAPFISVCRWHATGGCRLYFPRNWIFLMCVCIVGLYSSSGKLVRDHDVWEKHVILVSYQTGLEWNSVQFLACCCFLGTKDFRMWVGGMFSGLRKAVTLE